MSPETQFCHNEECPAKGQVGKQNICIHSRKQGRYRCNVCKRTFSERTGTMMYRLRTPEDDVICIITLLGNGCPVQAIVQAFGYHEETVRSWWLRAGAQCEAFHQHLVESQQFDLEHVQADEIKVKQVGQSVWMALALMVSTRLWLAGAISPKRDKQLIRKLANKIRQMARQHPLLLAVDGLASYVSAFRLAFRSPHKVPGKGGRPFLIPWPNIAIVQVIKRRTPDFHIERRIVQGASAMIDSLRKTTQGFDGVTNTAYIERINATFRQRLSWLTRRARCAARQVKTVNAGMYVTGCFYNFCLPHRSLEHKVDGVRVPRSPAMAAGLTHEVWAPRQLLMYKVPPQFWVPQYRRGRPSKAFVALVDRWFVEHT